MKSDNAVRYGLRRSDLHVTLDGLAIKLALALGGWAAFQPIGGRMVVPAAMGSPIAITCRCLFGPSGWACGR
jgi:hypothetical protein